MVHGSGAPSAPLRSRRMPTRTRTARRPSARRFPAVYWNAAAAMFAYLFGRTAEIGLEVLGESQLIGYGNVQ